ncbi:MAG: SIS domain-containing protein [Chloroflexi bacterium]|nr:SIS domain-containing protein [Chloroflexota bacterium]
MPQRGTRSDLERTRMGERFRVDIAAQGPLVRAIAGAGRPGGELEVELQAAARLIGQDERPILIVGMGSSLHAGRTALPRFAAMGRFVIASDAGELLHFGLPGIPAEAIVVAISQSGRSAETVALATQLRATDPNRLIIGIVNDANSPLARLATATVALRAGSEAAVATRTFLASVVVLQLLADALTGVPEAYMTLDGLADVLTGLADDESEARLATQRIGAARVLEIIGRGAGLGLAHYAALTIKETAAFPCEALAGGEFRHGPLELVDASAAAIVLVPSGPTAGLAYRLVREIAAAGWPTWAIGSWQATSAPRELTKDGVLATITAHLDGPLADIPALVVLQQFAALLAEHRGRVPGVLLRSAKVTATQ